MKLVWIALGCGLALWLGEALLEYWLLPPGRDLWHLLLWGGHNHDLYLRLLTVAVFVGLALLLDRRLLDRRANALRLERLNRAYKVLAACNHALLHAEDENRLLEEICRIIVEIEGYPLAWVAYAEHDPEKSVRVVAKAGDDQGYLEQLRLSWDKNSEYGRGPTGTAIRGGKPYVNWNMFSNPGFRPWRDAAIKRGYASSVALPLQTPETILGALNIYADGAYAFGEDEVNLLTNLADNLAYGISVLRLRQHREQVLKENRRLAHCLLNVQEEERKTLARELHDESGQCLTAIQAYAQGMLGLSTGPAHAKVRASGEQILSLSKHLYGVLRGIMRRLHPASLDTLGLEQALRDQLATWRDQHPAIHCGLEVGNLPENLDDAQKINLYRILQEGLNNIAKYAEASEVWISLRVEHARLRLEIRDNGRGMDPAKTHRGLGLIGIRERVESLAGHFELESAPGHGVKLIIQVPIIES